MIFLLNSNNNKNYSVKYKTFKIKFKSFSFGERVTSSTFKFESFANLDGGFSFVLSLSADDERGSCERKRYDWS